MVNKLQRALCALVLPLLVACNAESPRVDASSRAALDVSVRQISNSLPEIEAHQFEAAVATILLTEGIDAVAHNKAPLEGEKQALARLHDQTYEEVVAMAVIVEPTIDGSSREAWKRSSARVFDSLPEERQLAFVSAVTALIADASEAKGLNVAPGQRLNGAETAVLSQTQESVYKKLHGKTGNEIIRLVGQKSL